MQTNSRHCSGQSWLPRTTMTNARMWLRSQYTLNSWLCKLRSTTRLSYDSSFNVQFLYYHKHDKLVTWPPLILPSTHWHCQKGVPYSGKCWREETLVNLANCWQIAKVFSLKFTEFNIYLPLLGHLPNFLLRNSKWLNSPMFYSANVFCYTLFLLYGS